MAKNTEEGESNQASKSKARTRIRVQIVMAVSVAVISLCALFVSVFQTIVLVDQQNLITQAEKGKLWPNLSLKYEAFTAEEGILHIGLEVSNVGLGPAIIDQFSIWQNEIQVSGWMQAYHQYASAEEFERFYEEIAICHNSGLEKYQVIPPGETVKLFYLEAIEPGGMPEAFAFYNEEHQPVFQIVYHSVFEDHWELKSNISEAEGTPALPMTAEEFAVCCTE